MSLKSLLTQFGSTRVPTPLAIAGQRIGIMGGSFNPAHEGHARVAETAMRRLKLDWLWWVVTPGNPLKAASQPNLASRMAGCEEFARDPRMKITSFEAELGTPFTAATLGFLEARYPSVRFVWVMGADNLVQFHRWQHWRVIARTMPIAVVDRPGWRLKALASPAARALQNSRVSEARAGTLAQCRPPAWVFLTTRLSQASSTELRMRAAQKEAEKPQRVRCSDSTN